jgi:hypothetical protein
VVPVRNISTARTIAIKNTRVISIAPSKKYQYNTVRTISSKKYQSSKNELKNNYQYSKNEVSKN